MNNMPKKKDAKVELVLSPKLLHAINLVEEKVAQEFNISVQEVREKEIIIFKHSLTIQ